MATSDAQPTALTGIGVSPGLVAGPVRRGPRAAPRERRDGRFGARGDPDLG